MKNAPLEPKSLFQHLKILPSSSAILLVILSTIIFAFIIWSIFFWMPIKIQGNGVTISKGGLDDVTAKSGGTVLAFNVAVGQMVKKGDLLVEIKSTKNQILFESAKIKIENLQNEYQRLKNQIDIEEKAITNALNKSIEATKFSIDQIEQRIKSLDYEVERRKKLYKKGLISGAAVKEAQSDLVQEQIEIETIKSNLASLYIDMSQGYRAEELSNKEWEIQDAEKDLLVLVAEIAKQKIYSNQDGRVIALLVDDGQIVEKGEKLLVIESRSDLEASFSIRGYFSVDKGTDIVKGTPIEIIFPHLNENEYGSMLGVAESISEYAVSTESLLKTVYNKKLAETLFGGSAAVIEVIISPLKNPNNPNEYLWTTPSPPTIDITTGTLCILQATVEERKPLYFVFPLTSFKKSPLIDSKPHTAQEY